MITISDEILTKNPEFSVGVLEFPIQIKNGDSLDDLIKETEEAVNNQYNIEDVIKIPTILSGRNAYKAFGKDPSRYRLAVESLFRRLSKGNTLYRINNAVDLGNILSVNTKKSIAVLDSDSIKGDIHIRLGTKEDEYYGIGRGKLNIENIPLYEDQVGPFGSSTSDTERTMIKDGTKNILLFIIAFNGKSDLSRDMEYAKELYSTYASVSEFKSYIL